MSDRVSDMVLHSSQQLSFPFLLQPFMYLSVPHSDTGHACSLTKFVRSTVNWKHLFSLVPIILLGTLRVVLENLCVGGY